MKLLAMQALALQFDLSETTYFLPTAKATVRLVTRVFSSRHRGPIDEDSGTDSACANLRGWMPAEKKPLSRKRLICRRDRAGRPCRLRPTVNGAGAIFVGSRVIGLGRGVASI